MPAQNLRLEIVLPLKDNLASTLERVRMAAELRARIPPTAWAAVERWALSVIQEAAVNRETALLAAQIAADGKGP